VLQCSRAAEPECYDPVTHHTAPPYAGVGNGQGPLGAHRSNILTELDPSEISIRGFSACEGPNLDPAPLLPGSCFTEIRPQEPHHTGAGCRTKHGRAASSQGCEATPQDPPRTEWSDNGLGEKRDSGSLPDFLLLVAFQNYTLVAFEKCTLGLFT